MVKDTFKDDTNIYSFGRINWFKFNNHHIRRLSFQLRATENRISNIIEQGALKELNQKETDDSIVDEIFNLIKNTRQSISDINDGKIKLYIPNKTTKTQ